MKIKTYKTLNNFYKSEYGKYISYEGGPTKNEMMSHIDLDFERVKRVDVRIIMRDNFEYYTIQFISENNVKNCNLKIFNNSDWLELTKEEKEFLYA
jgi:hypothetical protein